MQGGRIFYGWYILAAIFIMQIISIGLTALGFGVMVDPLSKEFGLGRGELYIGLIALLLGANLSAPVAGRMVDRFSARWIMLGGGIMFTAGALLFSAAQAPLVIMGIVFVMIGPVVNICGPVVTSVLLARWFSRMRGRVFGFSAISMSLGGFLMVPMLGWLVDTQGWRPAVAILGGGGGLTLALLALFVIRDHPSDLGLFPDGDSEMNAEDTAAAAQPQTKVPLKLVIGTHIFWLIAIAYAMSQAVGMVITSSLVPLAVDEGISISRAAFLTSAVAISGMITKFVIGFLAERMDSRRLFTASMLVVVLFLFLLLVPMTFERLLILCLLLGGAMGASIPLVGVLFGQHFSKTGYGTAMGFQGLVQIPFVLTSLFLVGQLHDLYGNYDLVFKICMGVSVLSALLMLLVSRPGKHEVSSPTTGTR